MCCDFILIKKIIFYFCGIEVLQETLSTPGRDVEVSSGNMDSVPGCTSSGAYPGDYSSVLSLVTNSELQPVKALLSYSLVGSLFYCLVYRKSSFFPTNKVSFLWLSVFLMF